MESLNYKTFNCATICNQMAFDYLEQHNITFFDGFEVRNFRQLWESTALGFNGMGGAAMTYALTTVVMGYLPHDSRLCHAYVFWSGRFAYEVTFNDRENSVFMDDLNKCHTAEVRECKERYNIDTIHEEY